MPADNGNEKDDAATPETAAAEPSPLSTDGDVEESNHWLRRLMDNPWALLVLGIVIPTVSYTLWGIVELMMIKDAPIPPFVP